MQLSRRSTSPPLPLTSGSYLSFSAANRKKTGFIWIYNKPWYVKFLLSFIQMNFMRFRPITHYVSLSFSKLTKTPLENDDNINDGDSQIYVCVYRLIQCFPR